MGMSATEEFWKGVKGGGEKREPTAVQGFTEQKRRGKNKV